LDMFRLVIVLLLCVGCSRDSEFTAVDKVDSKQVDVDIVSFPPDDRVTFSTQEELIDTAEAAAQREFAWRLLVGDGMTADPEQAIALAARAAAGGDAIAMLWTGRAALNEPVDQIEAAAWFILAQRGRDAATREDAAGELVALNLSLEELEAARARADALQKNLPVRGGQSSDEASE
jgi:hypothetical protein